MKALRYIKTKLIYIWGVLSLCCFVAFFVETREIIKSVYFTYQLLIGEYSFEINNLTLNICALATPFLIALTIILIFLEEFSKFLFSKFGKDHLIVCGLGNMSFSFCNDVIKSNNIKPQNLIIIEKDSKNPNIEYFKNLGIKVYIGDARSEEILKRVRVLKSSKIVLFSAQDAVNLEILSQIENLNLHSDKANLLEIFIHL